MMCLSDKRGPNHPLAPFIWNENTNHLIGQSLPDSKVMQTGFSRSLEINFPFMRQSSIGVV